jgi:hypothetical protein
LDSLVFNVLAELREFGQCDDPWLLLGTLAVAGLEHGDADTLKLVTPTTAELLAWWLGEDMVQSRGGNSSGGPVQQDQRTATRTPQWPALALCAAKRTANFRRHLQATPPATPCALANVRMISRMSLRWGTGSFKNASKMSLSW